MTEGQVATALLELYQHDGISTEPAGAPALADVSEHPPSGDQPLAVVIPGGNNDLTRYAEIKERSLIERGLKNYFLIEFPQTPGALRRFLDDVVGPHDDIIHFEYIKRVERETRPALVDIELPHRDELGQLIEFLKASPLSYTSVTAGSPLARFLL